MRTSPAPVIHGGAGNLPPRARLGQIRQRLRAVSERAFEHLQRRSALDTVVFAVQRLEDDPLFNAGTGSVLQRDRVARMSASVMDGPRLRCGAVLNIERVRNPVLVARALLEGCDRTLAGPEATRFARARGMPAWNPITPARLRQWRARMREHHGTVGAVALDAEGRLAAATSTGGKGFETPGRVSDSGLPVGNYANADVAISCTGMGEDIMDEALAVRMAQRVMDGMPLRQAFAKTFRELRRRRRRAGAIGLDRDGRFAWAATAPALFAVARTRRGSKST
jgi:L-asparaginase